MHGGHRRPCSAFRKHTLIPSDGSYGANTPMRSQPSRS